MTETISYLRFRLGHEWYGIDVDSVIEVLHFLELSELPAARPDVLGLMRVRDSVIPVSDMRLHFGLPASYSLTTPIIVVNTPSGLSGLVVDDVDDLEHIDQIQITRHDRTSHYITGVARLPAYLLLLLDISLLGEKIMVS